MNDVMTFIVAALGGGGLGAVAVKILSRDVDTATARKIAQEAAGADIANLRSIIAEVRDSESRKRQEIDDLRGRIEKLEERERHMLTRAAVHEAWDQLAFQYIVSRDASFPQPPPLRSAPPELPQAQD